jgi:hypothetical protein
MQPRITFGTTLVAVAAMATASGAGEGDGDLREELRRTREQVKSLLDRVAELEAKAAGPAAAPPPGTVGAAVEAYLKARPGGAGSVTAPKARSLKFSGQVDWWWERWEGSYRPNDPAGTETQDVGWLRSALRADADITADLRARIEVRDARYFGQEPSTTAQLQAAGAGLDLKEGWLEVDGLLGKGVTARLGRQVLSYGDERLLGASEWHTYGRSFDGAVVTGLVGNTRWDLLAARVVERGQVVAAPGVDIADTDLYGLYTQTPAALHHSDLDAYLLAVRSPLDTAGEAGGTGSTEFVTGGVRLAGSKGSLDWGLEVAHQRGKVSGDRLRAFAAHARAGYTLSGGWQPRVGLEWNRASGDSGPTSGSVHTFQVLFPTDHDKYGILDLMAWSNAVNYRLSISAKPAKDWTVSADLHRFYLDESESAWTAAHGGLVRAGAAGAGRYLGSEVDLVVRHRVNDHLTVALGGGQFFDGAFVRDTGPANDATWVYLRIVATF